MSFFKKVLPKSINSRFFAILIIPVVFSQLIFGILFFGKYTEKVIGTLSSQISGEIISLSLLLDSNLEPNIIENIKKNLNLNIEILEDVKLNKFGIEKNNKIYRTLRNAFNSRGISNYYITQFKKNITTYICSQNSKKVYKISFLTNRIYTRIIPIVLGWGIASSILLLIIAFIFLKNQIRPIKKLAKAVEKFGNNLDDNEFIAKGAKEIRLLSLSFCEMKKNLRNLMNNKMQTLAGISHDLKTPLTKMKLQLSIMKKNNEIEWLINDVNTMIKITESFTLHSLKQNKEAFVYRNLYSFLIDIKNDFKLNNFNIYITGSKDIQIYLKYISMKRAISNIISNSIKYAKNLYIDYFIENKKVFIYLEDDGIGIPTEFLDIIFTPFISSNKAKTHENDSINVGLGLSIARDSIIDQGGEIIANNSKKYKGASFLITLPI